MFGERPAMLLPLLTMRMPPAAAWFGVGEGCRVEIWLTALTCRCGARLFSTCCCCRALVD